MCGCAPTSERNVSRWHCFLLLQGRTLVYAIVYSLGATRCIILHLATSESLQHAIGGEEGSLMLCGLTVALVSLALVQVRFPLLHCACSYTHHGCP